ncbi:MAG: hypothetical protein LBN21_01190, partial [Treponema sp.]|nr:hypothetical protein [Treponema sp.]
MAIVRRGRKPKVKESEETLIDDGEETAAESSAGEDASSRDEDDGERAGSKVVVRARAKRTPYRETRGVHDTGGVGEVRNEVGEPPANEGVRQPRPRGHYNRNAPSA